VHYVRFVARRELSTLLEGGSFFEGPRWHAGRWWVSDFYRHTVATVDVDGRQETVLEVEAQPSGLGWMPDDSLLVVSMKDHRVLRRGADGSLATHAVLSSHCGGPLNDMVVDTAGRAYVGNFGFELMAAADPAPAVLCRVDPDGAVQVVAEDLLFPNGSVITPDGRTLIVGETLGCRYRVHDRGRRHAGRTAHLGATRSHADLGRLRRDPPTGDRRARRMRSRRGRSDLDGRRARRPLCSGARG